MFLRLIAGSLCLTATVLGGEQAESQKRVEEYLAGLDIKGAVIRPITEEYIARTFANFSFYGVIFRQYPVAVECPQSASLKCSNVFYVKGEQVGFASTIPDLQFLFAKEMRLAPSEQEANDAANTWLRLSEELKQDLFYHFSAGEISYEPREDLVVVKARTSVDSGGEGAIEIVMTLGRSGSYLNTLERFVLKAGIRPICQATKLLDPDPIVRRMAEQDILVMGIAAKPYLDEIRSKSKPELQQAIDRIWKRILERSR